MAGLVLLGVNFANNAMTTETTIFTALRAFILGLVTCEVIRLPVNRVAMPVGEFIALSPLSNIPLATNVGVQAGQQKTITQARQVTVQVDCYGPGAGDNAAKISMLFRDFYGCEALAAIDPGVQPLYATDAHQAPLVDGEAQYVERWTFDCVVQVSSAQTVAQDAAIALRADVRNVDRTYPP